MIVAVLTILAASGDRVQMRSLDAFGTLAACEAFLIEDAPNRAAFRQALADRLGQPVALDARCVRIAPGVSA